MRLGLKPKMREKNSTRVQIPYELSHVPSHFSRHEHSFGNLTALMHPTDNLRYESHRIIESLGNLLHACMNSSFCMPVLHSDCSHAWNSHSDHSECAGQLLYRDFRGFVTSSWAPPQATLLFAKGGSPRPPNRHTARMQHGGGGRVRAGWSGQGARAGCWCEHNAPNPHSNV